MEDYLQCSFQELHRDDGLLVLGKGLGLEALCGKFLRLYAEQPLNRRRDLVLCINAGGKERSIRTAIISDGGMPDMLPKVGRCLPMWWWPEGSSSDLRYRR